MELLNTIREKVSQTAIEAVKKSNEIMETVKVNFTIADKEAEVSKAMREMGKLVYEAYKYHTEYPTDEVAEKCGAIDILLSEIEELKVKLVDLKKIKVCKACNFESNETYEFCPKCGAKLD